MGYPGGAEGSVSETLGLWEVLRCVTNEKGQVKKALRLIGNRSREEGWGKI